MHWSMRHWRGIWIQVKSSEKDRQGRDGLKINIARKERAERSKRAITGLPMSVADRFAMFCRFKGRSLGDVAAEALTLVMDHDREFQEHEKQKPAAAKVKTAA